LSTTGSPSSSAGLCRPARSPGKAGRSRAPGAPSYSNMCFQTEEGTNNRGGQKRFQSDHQLSGSSSIAPDCWDGALISCQSPFTCHSSKLFQSQPQLCRGEQRRQFSLRKGFDFQ
uniref:Uncharacterized protein n=1 Tax=Seriola lalandi dorsalis TaxID=1841481 RepID=A0A3B4YGT6_SERLL